MRLALQGAFQIGDSANTGGFWRCPTREVQQLRLGPHRCSFGAFRRLRFNSMLVAPVRRAANRPPPSVARAGTLDAKPERMENLDTVLEREVLEELGSNHGVQAANLAVKADAGVVKITGTVRSIGECDAAEQAAFGVRGVIDVDNELLVKPGGANRSDMDIAHAVRHALVSNPFVPDDLISSNVADGVVRLHGIVSDPVERDEAERSIRGLAGVRHVHNLIEVHQNLQTAARVKASIEAALEQHADAEADLIRVDVHEGCVSLSGPVLCAAHRSAAIRAAEDAPGVRSVEDRLQLVSPL
jgi:osmotically-inducible protein OsmY